MMGASFFISWIPCCLLIRRYLDLKDVNVFGLHYQTILKAVSNFMIVWGLFYQPFY